MFDFLKKTTQISIEDLRGKEWEELESLATQKVSQGPEIDDLVTELIALYRGRHWGSFDDSPNSNYREHPINVKGREIGLKLHNLADNDTDAFYLMQFVAYRVALRAKGDCASLLNSVWHGIGQWRN